MTYADKTEVSPERSRAEIEQTLARYGADSFAYMSSPDGGMIAFRYNGRNVRFEVRTLGQAAAVITQLLEDVKGRPGVWTPDDDLTDHINKEMTP